MESNQDIIGWRCVQTKASGRNISGHQDLSLSSPEQCQEWQHSPYKFKAVGKRYKGDEDLPELLEDPVSLLLLLVAMDAHRLIPADKLSNNHSWVGL